MMKKLRILSFGLVMSLLTVVLAGCRGDSSAPQLSWLSGFSGTAWDSFAAVESAGLPICMPWVLPNPRTAI